MIQFDHVSKSFGDKIVLKNQSFTIANGEFLLLVGPSGSGKTTILKMLNRLIDLTDGKIIIDGTQQNQLDMRQLRLSMGYVLQQIALFPNLTVAENIALIPKMKKWSTERIKERTNYLLDRVGLTPDNYLDRYPKDLSGGEQLQLLTKELHQEFGMTTIFVTHDVREALGLADRIAVLNQGELVQLAEPGEILEQPANAFVAELFGGVRND